MTDLAAVAAAAAEQSGIRLDPVRVAEALEQLSAEGEEPRRGEPPGEALVRSLIDALTVKESFFLRQPEQLRALDWSQLLAGAMADGRSRVRVWSAACARGEEPYTLAMLASEWFGTEPPPVDVLGTDISDSALKQAAAGVYRARAVRHVTPEVSDRFFEPGPSGLAVGDGLRSLVRFRRHNLSRDPMPPAGEAPFDLVVCRNVLIYFEAPAIDHFTGSLGRALAPGGRLVLGAADRLCLGGAARRKLAPALEGSASPPRPLRADPPSPPPRADARARARPAPERAPRDVTDPALAGALRLADEGRLEEASTVAGKVVAGDPMNAPGHFVKGAVELARDRAPDAVRHLRSALYADPTFAAAAFHLGRAHDALGEDRAARRAYRIALEHLEAGGSTYPWLLEETDAADVAVACAVRLKRDRVA